MESLSSCTDWGYNPIIPIIEILVSSYNLKFKSHIYVWSTKSDFFKISFLFSPKCLGDISNIYKNSWVYE